MHDEPSSAAPGSTRRDTINAMMQVFSEQLRSSAKLRPRLIELVRLRIAFHNQCRYCMSMRYGSALDDGLTEAQVCSLERPAEDPDLTAADIEAALTHGESKAA